MPTVFVAFPYGLYFLCEVYKQVAIALKIIGYLSRKCFIDLQETAYVALRLQPPVKKRWVLASC